jgi:hypothetical protein
MQRAPTDWLVDGAPWRRLSSNPRAAPRRRFSEEVTLVSGSSLKTVKSADSESSCDVSATVSQEAMM